ncbi:MAG TPA: hypothetical protein VFC84_14695 [Desulfosporosinus sp.]|nr:hypothetical protein [Desulfosporosinus sp.]
MTKTIKAGTEANELGAKISNLSIIVILRSEVTEKQDFIDSVEVAKIAGKKHSNLVRSITKFVERFDDEGTNSYDYFMLKETPRGGMSYLISKLGCEYLGVSMPLKGGYYDLFDKIFINHFMLRKTEIKKQIQESDRKDTIEIAEAIEARYRIAAVVQTPATPKAIMSIEEITGDGAEAIFIKLLFEKFPHLPKNYDEAMKELFEQRIKCKQLEDVHAENAMILAQRKA